MDTKGEWKYEEELGADFSAIHDGRAIICGLPNPGLYNPEEVEEMRTNAHLIVTATNNCRAVNPGNPLAAAEAIQEMYKALRLLLERFNGLEKEYAYPMALDLPRVWAEKALAKAEGKEE